MYLRVSTEDQVEKFGPDIQKAAIEGLVKSKGTSMVLAGEQYIYFDEGISGTIELESRPEFARLMYDIRDSGSKKPFDVVAVFKLDRFARKLRILLDVIEYLDKSQIGFISTSESIDTSTPYGRAMVGITGAIAELELETIMERTQQGKEQANRKRKQDNTVYLLSSLLKCDHCRKLITPPETNMITWTGTRKKIATNPDIYSYYYQCGRKNVKKFGFTCPVVPIPSISIEEYITKFVHDLLKDPKAVFEYQKGLKSSRLLTKHLQERHEDLVKSIKGCPKRRENILYQHEQGYLNKVKLNEKLNEVNLSEIKMKSDLAEVDRRLSTITLSKGYEASLELYSKKYANKAFDKLSKDKTELYDLIHILVDQVVVYSRPVTEDDVIAGRKKKDQTIPERIDIFLNLPQHLLQQLYGQKFAVKHDNL